MDRWLREQTVAYETRDRVCLDVEAALVRFPALRPKSDVYTYDDGRTQLLLCLHGLLQITFKGSSYNIPIAVWLTRDYPRSPPISYVVPTPVLLIRPSKYVDLNGRCSIDYIHDWIRKPEPCNLAALLQAMQDHFSHTPPLYAKPKPPSPRPAPQPQSPLSLPLSRPQSRHDDRPALPPKPVSSKTPALPSRPIATPLGYSQTDLYNRPPPQLPQQPRVLARPPQYQKSTQGLYATDGNTLRSPIEHSRDSSSPTTPNYRASMPPDALTTIPFPGSQSPPTHVRPPVPPSAFPQHTPHATRPRPRGFPPPVTQHNPSPNLLEDEFPAQQPPPAPAPPRPPNPELLQLHAQVHDKIRSEFSSLSQLIRLEADRLRAQQTDLLTGEPAIRDEMARLEAVRDVCRNVAARLGSTVEQADRNLAELRRKGDPEVDELVCSTTIVHNQLINLVAEDNAIEDTIYHLHRALNTGRIDLERFLRTTRVLAEEQFMKRALIDKIQEGIPMGMSLPYS
ncbi:UEV domain-containing protein [Boletus edulis BED1]|uniref:UEV domain-containing protein n=1 Tax=Boletus edulis BED1 TaxID=1328754 RepID=A0AAD4C4T0_BOLED|nr:UEV domain-containing protein [Boletus edulis BED1]